MQSIDRDGVETYKKRRRGIVKNLVLFAAVLLFVFIATGANAFVCTDCHTGPMNPHGASCSSTDCASCHGSKNIMHPAGSGTPAGCTACHTTTPHPTVGAGTSLDTTCVTSACHGTGGAAHLFTAAGLAPYGAIHTGLSVPSTDCGVCHGEGGLVPAEHYNPTATCSSCHSRPGEASTMVLAHPDAVGGPSHDCLTCHTVGIKPNEITACATSACHGPDGIAHLRNDFSTLQMLAKEMHVPGDIPRSQTCEECHDGVFQQPFAHPVGGAECSTCHPRAGVSPTDVETCKTCHESGPAHIFSEATLTTRAHDMHQFGASVPSTICTDCHGAKTLYYPMGTLTCRDCHTVTTRAAAFASCTTAACHPTMTNAADVGKDMHSSTPKPNFTAPCDTTTSYKINFDATAYPHTCPNGYTCTYSWDFGQSGGTTTNANTATPSHTYTSSGTFPVTLTMTATGGGSASVTKSVPTCTVNQPPTCGRTAFVFTPGNIVSFTDTSTDDGVGGPALVSVNWGDTKTDLNKPLLTSLSHTYAATGSYLIMQTVMDAAGAISECAREYVVPVPAGAKFTVTVNMSKAAPYASVKVLQNGSIKSQGSTGATGLTWTSAALPAAANYTLSVFKTGKTFSCNGAAVDLSSGNRTIACTVTP